MKKAFLYSLCSLLLLLAVAAAIQGFRHGMPDSHEQPRSLSFAQDSAKAPAPPEITVSENEAGEAVFILNTADFVQAFNRYYRLNHDADYLSDLDGWDRISGDRDCRRFAADIEQSTRSELLMYLSDDGEISEIVLSFDHHGYRQEAFNEYREMCLCALQCFLPGTDLNYVNRLFDTLYAEALDNSPQRTATLYRFGGLGLYGYYGIGTVNIALVPLTESAVEAFVSDGFEMKQGEL